MMSGTPLPRAPMMRSSVRPTGPAQRDLDHAVRGHVLEFFHSSRYLAPLGNSLAALFTALVVHSRVDEGALISWLVAAATLSASMLLVLLRPQLLSTDPHRLLPFGYIVTHLACGVLWGLLPWLSVDPANTEYRWIALCFMFAISAGALGGISGTTQLTLSVLVPMWTIGSLAMLVAGQWVLALAMICFLTIVVRDNRSATKLLVELIRLRVESAALAASSEWEATHDPLTGLPNRAGLDALARPMPDAGTITAMFVDLDHFKEVNDRFGHLVGDLVLTEAAARLRAAVRDDDVVGRLGGDEFLVLLQRDIDAEASASLADRVIADLEAPFTVGDHDVYVSASIGITRVPAGQTDVNRLVHQSDKALYHAKRNGRRQAVVLDRDLELQLRERSGLEMALRRALRSDEIGAWGQPVYDLATGRVAWVELLARWEPTPGSFVPPSVFVPLAEDIGVVGDLDRRMLAHAATALARWRTHPVLSTADIAVNISALHLARGQLDREVSELVACHDLRPERLIVEITESHRLADTACMAAMFHHLVQLGTRLAVDDFGTGYSSLGQLLELPISIVKIDRSLTAGSVDDVHRTGIVAAIRQLAASLGHIVVAEGIETAADRDAMRSLGIDQAQGFLFCPPLPLNALEAELLRPASQPSQPSRLG